MPIRELWTVHAPQRGSYESWLQSLARAGTQVVRPSREGARLGAARLEVLWPQYSSREEETGPVEPDPILSVNDNSLVVRLRVFGRSILFAGDIEREAEELLTERYGAGLRSDLVKVPHHGSRTSSTEAFVSATSPEVAIISCGRANRFDFPDAHVAQRWQAVATLLRTDEVGSVTVQIAESGAMWLDTYDPFPWMH